MPDSAKPLRVLVSEGSSTSAREAITILGSGLDQRRAACDDRGIAAGFAEISDQTRARAHLLDLASIRMIEEEELSENAMN